MKTEILSVIYEEPEWIETVKGLARCGIASRFVGRKGVGSLSEAINRGVRESIPCDVDLIWILTNPVFRPEVPGKLARSIMATGYATPSIVANGWAAVHPAFNSSHIMMRSQSDGLRETAFVEFTAPMVRAELLRQYPLDEDMPYVGFDLDWSYRVRRRGWSVGVDDRIHLRHVYLKNAMRTHPATEERKRRRAAALPETHAKLESKYGKRWRYVLGSEV